MESLIVTTLPSIFVYEMKRRPRKSGQITENVLMFMDLIIFNSSFCRRAEFLNAKKKKLEQKKNIHRFVYFLKSENNVTINI